MPQPEVSQFKASQQLVTPTNVSVKMTKVVKSKKKTSIKAKTTEKEDPMSQFAPEIGEFFKTTLGFKTFTPVQVSFYLLSLI
uniref:Uncharacterized protein n=1 Tax=Panagrolaimus davidi TaxID=227884 RepID=A0A914P9B2_9BILA